MCIGGAVILTAKGAVLTVPHSDSHEDIIEYYNLQDKAAGKGRWFLRLEMKPQSSLFTPDWEIVIEEDRDLPSWYIPALDKKRVEKVWAALIAAGRYKEFKGDVNLNGCTGLTSLGGAVFKGDVYLIGCTGLTSLAGAVFGGDVYLIGCTGLTSLAGAVFGGKVNLKRCTGLTSLAGAVFPYYVDLTDCTKEIINQARKLGLRFI
jgi:hypothetical protein